MCAGQSPGPTETQSDQAPQYLSTHGDLERTWASENLAIIFM